MTTELLLIRHGETAMSGLYCGQLDPALCARGQQQSLALVASLAHQALDAIHSSDLQRASALAAMLASSKGVPCQTDPALREMHFGAWEGLHWSAIEQLDAPLAANWLADFPHLTAPGAEQFSIFERRVLDRVLVICSGPGARAAIVTHAGVMRVVLQHLARCSFQQAWQQPIPLCSTLRLTRDAGSNAWRLIQ